jgi:hypothetical protein
MGDVGRHGLGSDCSPKLGGGIFGQRGDVTHGTILRTDRRNRTDVRKPPSIWYVDTTLSLSHHGTLGVSYPGP